MCEISCARAAATPATLLGPRIDSDSALNNVAPGMVFDEGNDGGRAGAGTRDSAMKRSGAGGFSWAISRDRVDNPIGDLGQNMPKHRGLPTGRWSIAAAGRQSMGDAMSAFRTNVAFG